MNLRVLGSVLGLVTFHLFLLINSQFTVWPEMVLYPYLVLNDFKLFTEIVNPYFPLLTLSLAGFFNMFGLSVLGLKIFTYLVILVSDILVFNCAYLFHKNISKSFLSLIVFIILQYSFGGNGLWFELVLVPFVLLSLIYLFTSKLNTREVLLSGTLLAFCLLMKQNAGSFFIPVVFWLLVKKKLNLLPLVLAPTIIGVSLLFFYLASQNSLDDFINWTIRLPLDYTSQSGFLLLPTKRQFLIIFTLLLPYLFFFLNSQRKYSEKIFWGLVFLISTSFIFPRYENFHLQVLIPFTALFLPFLNTSFAIFLLAIYFAIFAKSIPQIWGVSDRFLDHKTLILTEKIKDYPSVYLLNSPELAYFLAGKLPPKPWGTNFPWYFENFNFEDKFIAGLRKSNTEYVIVGDRVGGEKYALGNYIPEKLLIFIREYYILTDRIDSYEIWKRKN